MPLPIDLLRRVQERAKGHCEYCQLPQGFHPWRFQADHIIAQQHGGKTQAKNLALACPRCNRNKGPNIAGIDRETGSLTPLFHPRKDAWTEHFRWRGPRLIGITPIGRTTLRVLGINATQAVELRRQLIAEGVFPPSFL
jgi:hypothetical protein